MVRRTVTEIADGTNVADVHSSTHHRGEVNSAADLEDAEAEEHGVVAAREHDRDRERGRGHHEEPAVEELDRVLLDEQLEELAADHEADHEASEHQSVREARLAGLQRALERRRPHEHEDVHGGLEAGLDDAEEEDLLAADEQSPGLVEVLETGRDAAVVAEVLLPAREDHISAANEQHQRRVEGRDVAEGLDEHGREESRADGHEARAEGHVREGVGHPVLAVPARAVLVDHPRLERAHQDRRADAAQQPPQHQDRVVVEVLRDARDGVQQHKDQAVRLAAVPVRHAAHNRAEHQTAAETHDEQHRDVSFLEAVLSIELVNVRALHNRCAR